MPARSEKTAEMDEIELLQPPELACGPAYARYQPSRPYRLDCRVLVLLSCPLLPLEESILRIVAASTPRVNWPV